MTDAADAQCVRAAVAPWEDPPRAARTDVPILSVDGFEGPLDWLLEMVRAQTIELAKLSIAALIGAFSAALEAALARPHGQAAELGRLGDWLVMAATLAWLRSRLLLPPDAPEARAAEREAETLRHQLVSRAQMTAAADWLDRRTQLGSNVFAREMPEVRGMDRVGDITELLRACLVVLRVPDEQAAAARPRPPPLWRVTDAIDRIGQLIPVLSDGSPLGAFLPGIGQGEPCRELRCRAAVASTLIAGLELARTGDLHLTQKAAWTPIHVHQSAGHRTAEGSDAVPG
ncbi:MAG: segregation/condensation protein A [Rhodospirillales bacterium]|nr:segregation/condensation protein A [Rhodospirillales bacterium]